MFRDGSAEGPAGTGSWRTGFDWTPIGQSFPGD